MAKDFYDILVVSKNASKEEIKAEQKFKEISRAP
jgi:DnaJ-class molecular chaperone